MVIFKGVPNFTAMEKMAEVLDRHGVCLVSVISRPSHGDHLIIGQSETDVDEDQIDKEYDLEMTAVDSPPLRM